MSNILIADDNQDLVSIMKVYLERTGHFVVSAFNGDDAIKATKEWPIHLMILDISMPKKGGLEVYRDISTRYGHSKVPVLILTGHNEYQELCQDIDVDGFLTKPFEMEELRREVTRILDKNSKPSVFIADFEENAHAKKMIETLQEERYTATLVEDLIQFKVFATQAKPEAVFMEYVRQDMAGTDFIRRMKESMIELWGKAVPIIVYSFSGFDYSKKCLAAGADQYITKPSDYGVFLRILREYELQRKMNGHGPAAAASSQK